MKHWQYRMMTRMNPFLTLTVMILAGIVLGSLMTYGALSKFDGLSALLR